MIGKIAPLASCSVMVVGPVRVVGQWLGPASLEWVRHYPLIMKTFCQLWSGTLAVPLQKPNKDHTTP